MSEANEPSSTPASGDSPWAVVDIEAPILDLQASLGVLRHLARARDAVVTTDQWIVAICDAMNFADLIKDSWDDALMRDRARDEANKAELAAIKSAAAPGSKEDFAQIEALRTFMRSAATTFLTMLDRRSAAQDGDLIKLCDRLVEIHAAENLLFDTIKDDAERDRVAVPIREENEKIGEQLVEIGLPVTLRGAEAMARAANVNVALGTQGHPTANHMGDWLALAACAFLAGSPPPRARWTETEAEDKP